MSDEEIATAARLAILDKVASASRNYRALYLTPDETVAVAIMLAVVSRMPTRDVLPMFLLRDPEVASTLRGDPNG